MNYTIEIELRDKIKRLEQLIDSYERGLISTPYTRALVDQAVASATRYHMEVIRLNRVVARQSAKIKRMRDALRLMNPNQRPLTASDLRDM